MQGIQLASNDLRTLTSVELPDPGAPGPNQVLLKMRAAAFNYLDLLVATGRYTGAVYPVVPVADGAGEVIAIGEGVEGLAIGDRVAVHPKARWPAGRVTAARARTMRGVTTEGSLREFAVNDADTLVKAPAGLSWEQIACLPIPAATGWNGLRAGAVGPASTVVVTGTGVTALQTLQLAHAAGARVIVTSSSGEKLDRAIALGADHGINYRDTPCWENEVLALTDGVGADLVFDSAGAETLPHALDALAHGGTLFSVGFVSGTSATLSMLPVISKSLRIAGYNTGSAADLREAMDVVGRHGLQPVIAETHSIRDILSAYRAFDYGGRFGKIAVTLDW